MNKILNSLPGSTVPTKRRHIYQALHEYIRTKATAGDHVPSTDVLARHFSVSYVTMHTALSDLARDGLLVRRKHKGTVVADPAATRSLSTALRFVVVVPPQQDIDMVRMSDVVLAVLRGCAKGAAGCAATVAFHTIPSVLDDRAQRTTLEFIARFNGLLVLGDQYAALVAEAQSRGIKTVEICAEQPVGVNVHYDRTKAVRLAVRHLWEHGYRHIGYFGAIDGPDSVQKFAMFREELMRRGRPDTQLTPIPCVRVSEAVEQAIRFCRPERHLRPRAVFIDNEYKAATFLLIALQHGLRIPADLAIIGYGAHLPDLPMPLTMVALPYHEMGAEAVRLLAKPAVRPAGAKAPRLLLPARLLPGTTCGCLPAVQPAQRCRRTAETRRQTNPTDKNDVQGKASAIIQRGKYQ